MENKEISSPDPRVSFGADKGYELMPTREIIVDGQSVGIISLRLPSEGNFCEITEIALLDQYQGKGLGKEALLMLDQELKSKNMILVSGKD
jgi:ribosomal protein S18 acetylase RimI-like enzyme